MFFFSLSGFGQQSAEAPEVLYLDKETNRGVKTLVIQEQKSVVGIKARHRPVMRGRVYDITDSTITVGRETIPLSEVEYFQGNMGRKRMNILMVLLPTAILLLVSLFGGFFLLVEIFGAFWLVNGGAPAILFLLGVMSLYFFIPMLALWVDAVVRFFSKLPVPNPWHFRDRRFPASKGLKS